MSLTNNERLAFIELAQLVVDLTNKVTARFDQKDYEATKERNQKIKALLAPGSFTCPECGKYNCDCWRYEP